MGVWLVLFLVLCVFFYFVIIYEFFILLCYFDWLDNYGGYVVFEFYLVVFIVVWYVFFFFVIVFMYIRIKNCVYCSVVF